MAETLFQFSRVAVRNYSVTLLAGNDVHIGSVKQIDSQWWALTTDGSADGPHGTRAAAAHWLLSEYNRESTDSN
jgi:hypothetical protein